MHFLFSHEYLIFRILSSSLFSGIPDGATERVYSNQSSPMRLENKGITNLIGRVF